MATVAEGATGTMMQEEPVGITASAPATLSRAAQWFAVALLTSAYIVSYMDRLILSLMVGPIKADLGISDTQLGLIQGIAFGLVFTVAGVPMGWLADRVPRRKLLAVCIALWSLLTAACGFAGSYAQLFVARTGVGLGEAAIAPSGIPMIREIMPRDRVVTAISVFMLGIPVGSGLALILGGTILPAIEAMGTLTLPLLGTLKPWQATFVIVSLPGLAVALLMLAVKEPPRARVGDPLGAAPLPVALRFVRAHWITFVGFGLPGVASMLMTFGVGFWIPAAFERSFALPHAEVAGYVRVWGLMTVGLGIVGTLCGGVIADYMRKRREDGYVLLALASIVLLAVSYGSFTLMPSPRLALIALIPAAFGVALPPTAASAAAMELIPRQMRSLVFAAWMLVIGFLGAGFGPLVIGLVTDRGFGNPAALRYAIPLVVLVMTCIAVPLLLGIRGHYRNTMKEAERISTGAPYNGGLPS